MPMAARDIEMVRPQLRVQPKIHKRFRRNPERAVSLPHQTTNAMSYTEQEIKELLLWQKLGLPLDFYIGEQFWGHTEGKDSCRVNLRTLIHDDWKIVKAKPRETDL